MTKADDYNAAQLASGALTPTMITVLVKAWQADHDLDVDGFAGPLTLSTLRPTSAFTLSCPLPALPDGRKAQTTSGFRPADRKNHDGVDFFYPWKPGDQPDRVGDGLAEGRTAWGEPKWGVPYGVPAIAAAGGLVTVAGDSTTGHRVWIDHGNGLRTGYFHLLDLAVTPGQIVERGDALGLVGHNPADTDGRHLHFEVSRTETYHPLDPAPFFSEKL